MCVCFLGIRYGLLHVHVNFSFIEYKNDSGKNPLFNEFEYCNLLKPNSLDL